MVARTPEPQHLARGDRRPRDARGDRDAQPGVGVRAAVAREHRPAFAGERLHEPRRQARVAGVAADRLGGVVERLLDGLGRAQGAGDLGDDVQAGRAAIGLLPQRGPLEGRGDLIREGPHQQRVGVVELVGAQVAQADHRLAAAIHHDRRRQQRLVPRRRPRAAGIGEVGAAEQRLLPGADHLADDARPQRVRRHRHGVAPARDRPHPLRPVAVVGHGRPHRGVVGVPVQGHGDRPQQLVDRAGGRDLPRQVGRELEPLRAPLRLVLQPPGALAHAHADERGRHLVGHDLHEGGVGRVEPVGLDVRQLEHPLAAALHEHRRQDERLPASVRRPRVARVGRRLGQDELGALSDAGPDQAGVEPAPDRLGAGDVAAEVDHHDLVARPAIDDGRGDAGVARVLEDRRRRHPERLVDRGGAADGARHGLHERELLGAQVGPARRRDRVCRELAHRREQRRLLAERGAAGIAADHERRHRVAVDVDRHRQAGAALGPGRQRLSPRQRQHQRTVGPEREAGAVGDLAQGVRWKLVWHGRIVLPVGLQSLRNMGEVVPQIAVGRERQPPI